MFVIMQSYSNLSDEQKSSLPLPERIGLTMRHAGAAITVTSLTDVCAFAVGAVTVSHITIIDHFINCLLNVTWGS